MVAGSIVLELINSGLLWRGRDLNIYIDKNHMQYMVEFFKQQGYKVYQQKDSGKYYKVGFSTITKMVNGEHYINVVKLLTNYSLFPIA